MNDNAIFGTSEGEQIVSKQLQPYYDNAIPVVPVDYTYHTDENDVCWDESYPYKTDKRLLDRLQ